MSAQAPKLHALPPAEDPAAYERRKVRELLIFAVDGLVTQRASYYTSRFRGCVERDELVSVGSFALARAASRFVPERGAAWRSFARQWINGAMLRAVRTTQQRARRERAMFLAASRIQTAYRDDYDVLNHQDAVLATKLTSFFEAILIVSMTAACDEDAQNPEAELEAIETSHALRDAIAAALRVMPPQDKKMIWLIYHEGYDIEETTGILGISRATAYRRHTRALSVLRAAVKRLDIAHPPPMRRWPLLDMSGLNDP